MRVMGIETSCDETGVAVYDSERGITADLLHSQIDVHAAFGGVVPELASRDHIRKLAPLVRAALQQSKCGLDDLDAIAYTAGPGLIGALLVGASFAQSLAWSRGLPSLPVHHMEGHLLAPLLEDSHPTFPFIALLVSGGHTLLVFVQAVGKYKIIGNTLDDAVGEAFDKTAKLLGLSYPGGPALANLARSGTPGAYQFPRPMTDRPGLDFSFSGLKTFALNTVAKLDNEADQLADVALAFEQAVVDTLAIKCKRAVREYQVTDLVVAGGVGANLRLRERLTTLMAQEGGHLYVPRKEFCTDNGAMIAYAGHCRLTQAELGNTCIQALARWSLDSLLPVDALD